MPRYPRSLASLVGAPVGFKTQYEEEGDKKTTDDVYKSEDFLILLVKDERLIKVLVVTPPLAKAMAMMAANSITQDRGFHINPKNLRSLFSYIFYPTS